mgnify:CR=1 FL=1
MEQGKEDRIVLYLKNCRIHLTTDTQVYFQKKLYISISGKPSLQPGNTLFLNGTLLEFPIATNPGMFNRREYYKEKGIYYEFRADSFQVLQYNIDPIKNILYHLVGLYEQALGVREGGVLSTMLLGEKNLLDAEVKQLYRTAGISHILAISGVKTLKLDIPLVPETRINWAFMPLHIVIIYILKLCLDEEIIPRCRFPCSRGYFKKCIN